MAENVHLFEQPEPGDPALINLLLLTRKIRDGGRRSSVYLAD